MYYDVLLGNGFFDTFRGKWTKGWCVCSRSGVYVAPVITIDSDGN